MKKGLVVIGGGFAGSYIAKKLQKKFNLTLIDDKDYFEFTPSVLRTIVEIDKVEKIRVAHKTYLKDAIVVMDTVNDIDREYVYTSEGRYKYDYLAICSGSNYSLPIKAHNLVEAARSESLIKSHDSLIASKKVMIIGGGLVGVELAAEIIDHYPKKQVTLISASDTLIPRNNKKSIKYVEEFLKKRGVDLVMNEKVISFKNKSYQTDKGNTYPNQLGYICTGIVPNYKFMTNHFKSSLDERNQIIVNDFLQVKDQINIFCAGDINNLKIEKTAQGAVSQAKTISKNILALSKGKDIKKHKHKTKGMIISLGKYDGVLESKHFTLTGKFPALLKYLLERFEMSRYK